MLTVLNIIIAVLLSMFGYVVFSATPAECFIIYLLTIGNIRAIHRDRGNY